MNFYKKKIIVKDNYPQEWSIFQRLKQVEAVNIHKYIII